jgi:hypothetical protein
MPNRTPVGGGRVKSNLLTTTAHVRFENALIKALARAHRWRRKIEGGGYASITELAKAEKVNQSYACRLLWLTLLSPDIDTAVLHGRLDPTPTVNKLMKPISIFWETSRSAFPAGRLPLAQSGFETMPAFVRYRG